nr:ribonuclease H-like domain-containing protein [Tanacetum cinerariifolium]
MKATRAAGALSQSELNALRSSVWKIAVIVIDDEQHVLHMLVDEKLVLEMIVDEELVLYMIVDVDEKIGSQLAILVENISQEDLNMKFLRSFPTEWNTHTVVSRNKADLDTISIDDLYNNFKIIEQEVKRTVTISSSSVSQNMDFLSSPGSTNEVDTANIQVSTVSTPVSTISTHDNTANLSDATMYAFLANQPNGSQLVYKDLEQMHEDDLEEMDLKWQLALLSMRAKRSPRNQESKPRNQDSSRKILNVEDMSSKAMVAIDGAGFDWSYGFLRLREKGTGQMNVKPVWNNTMRFNHQNFSNSRRNFAPTAVLTKSRIVPISTARQSSLRAAIPVSAARPINTAARDPQDALKDTRIFDSGCSSVSQMCDKKNSVLFIETEWLILSPDFKLPDESQVLLKVPIKNNMYSFDLKNVVSSKVRLVYLQRPHMMSLIYGMGGLVIYVENSETGSFKCKLLAVRSPFFWQWEHPSLAVGTYTASGNSLLAVGMPCKFDGKANEGFLVGYSINSKAFRVYNSRTRKVEENLHVNFLENKSNVTGRGQAGRKKVSDQEYILLPLLNTCSNVLLSHEEDESSPKDDAGKKSTAHPTCVKGGKNDDLGSLDQQMNSTYDSQNTNSTNSFNIASPTVNVASNKDGTFQRTNDEWDFSTPIIVNVAGLSFSHPATFDDYSKMTNLEDTGIFDDAYDDRYEGVEADYNNLETLILVSPIPSIIIHKDHSKEQIIEEVHFPVQTRKMAKQNEAGLLTFINKHRRTNHKISKIVYLLVFSLRWNQRSVKSASTQMETHNPLSKDADGTDVDVHLYSLDRKSTIEGCQFLDKKELAIQERTTTSKEFLNPLMAGSLPKTINLKFVNQHNMVAYLEKSDDTTEFHQIVDFLSSCLINYALTQIHAIVDGKAVVISESFVRSDLFFDDEDGLRGFATWDLDKVTWGGRAQGVGTVHVRWDVRECIVRVKEKKAGNEVGTVGSC